MAPQPDAPERAMDLAVTLIAALDSISDRCGPADIAARLIEDQDAVSQISMLRRNLERSREALADAVLTAKSSGAFDQLGPLLTEADRHLTAVLDWLHGPGARYGGDEAMVLDTALIRALDLSRELRASGAMR